MTSDFGGWTAEQYRRYRRDVPDAVVDQLVGHLGLGPTDRVLGLGAGTGQLVLPLARRLGLGVGLDPEPDMLRLLRDRARAEQVQVVTLLAGGEDLDVVRRLVGDGSFGLVATANALHWMDAAQVFADVHRLLRPGGGIAVVSHGVPLWLAATGWAQELNRFLQGWLGQPSGWMCGSDDATRRERAGLLVAAGFSDVTVLRHRYEAVLSPEYVMGHLYSALSPQDVPVERRPAFEQAVLSILHDHQPAEGLLEEVPVVTLVGVRRENDPSSRPEFRPVRGASFPE